VGSRTGKVQDGGFVCIMIEIAITKNEAANARLDAVSLKQFVFGR
jgi:hypothetical protein